MNSNQWLAFILVTKMADRSGEGESSDSSNNSIVVSVEDFESSSSSEESVVENEAEIKKARVVSRPSCSK